MFVAISVKQTGRIIHLTAQPLLLNMLSMPTPPPSWEHELGGERQPDMESPTSLEQGILQEEVPEGATTLPDLETQKIDGRFDADVAAATDQAEDPIQQLLTDFKQGKVGELEIQDSLRNLVAKAANVETQVDPKLQAFEACLESGGSFPLRNDKIGREWNKALADDADLRKKYERTAGRQAKDNMRKHWLRCKCDELRSGRSHSKSWEKVDLTTGEYMPFGKLVEGFGILYDRTSAVEAATRHAEKCIKMGGLWIQYDVMAEVCEFLKLRKGYTEKMAEAWKTWEEEHSGAATGSTSDGPQQTGKNSGAKAGGNGGESLRAAGNKRGSNVHTTPGKKIKKDTELDKALAEASKVKKLHNEATSRAENIAALIDAASEWAWARTKEGVGTLRQLLLDLHSKKSTAVNRFLLEDIKTLKKEVGAETLLVMALEFINLKSILESIDMKQSALQQAHKSMSK